MGRSMKYQTRDFGELDIPDTNIFEFIQPPFGFEEQSRFALLYDEEVGKEIAWLQSLEQPETCFILFDPSSLSSFYQPRIPESFEQELGEGELVCWVIGVVPGDFKQTTVNLKSPVVLNIQAKRGAQIILDQDYPVRYVLMQEAE